MKLESRNHRILVTDCETQAALACVRELGRSGYEVFGTGHAAEPPAAWSRYLLDYKQTHSAWTSAHLAWSQTLSFAEKMNCAAILPVSEATIASSMRWNDRISRSMTLLRANDRILKYSLSKIQFFKRALSLRLPVAAGQVVTPKSMLSKRLNFSYPMVLRTDNRWDRQEGYQKGRSWIVHSHEEWRDLNDELQDLGIEYLFQEFVTGEGCGAFFGMNKGYSFLWHTHERLAEIPWQGGVSARRKLTYNETLRALAEKFLEDLEFTGIAMLEFRRARRENDIRNEENSVYLVELNARPWGSLALAGHAQIPFLTFWLQSRGHHPLTQPKHHSRAFLKPMPSDQSQLVCTNLYPGEIQHLLSVFKSFLRRDLKLIHLTKFATKSLITILNPKTRYDFFMCDDVAPCIQQWKHVLSVFQKMIVNFALSIFARILATIHRAISFSTKQTLRSSAAKSINQILIVCQGNRCRSAFVEAQLRDTMSPMIKVFSRGLFVNEVNIPQRFHRYFKHQGLKPSEHLAQQLTLQDIARADLILLMERRHLLDVFRLVGFQALKKCIFLDDPLFGGANKDIQDPYRLAPFPARQIFETLKKRSLHVANLFQ